MQNRRISHHLSLRPRRGATHATLGELGFTIIEVVVSVAILGVIVVPLAMAFSAGFRVSENTGASLNASASRDQLAFRFNSDVASVDATGASRSNATCDTSSAGGGGTALITLNTTTQATATAVSTRVTYWVTGSGINVDVVRRACTNASPGIRKTDGRETVVADDVGFPGAIGPHIVHGPYDRDLGTNGSPCNEFRCQLEIDGRYRYRVVAQRRVYGAGVPLEIGKIYSSYETRHRSGPSILYEHTTGSGRIRDVEQRFTDQLTLPGGLDGPPLLNVYFAVQHTLSGKWLDCSSDPCAFTATSRTPNLGQYDESATVWKLRLPVGTVDTVGVLNAAGEYRVFTELNAGPSLPSKSYGGTAGFPFWIDWFPEDSVFVKPDGDDDLDGLTPDTAVATIDRALRVSAASGRGEVQVASGTYRESVTVSGTDFEDSRTLTGGHAANQGWLRGGSFPTASMIIPDTRPAGEMTAVGFRIAGKKMQKFRQMGIQSGSPNVIAYGASAFGLVVEDGSTVFLNNSSVISVQGVRGRDGEEPRPKGNACSGGDGKAASQAPVLGKSLAANRNTTWRGADYTAPGASCVIGDDARFGGWGGGGGAGLDGRGGDGGRGGGAPVFAAPGTGGSSGCLQDWFEGGSPGSSGRGGAAEQNLGNGGTPEPPSTTWSGLAYAGVSGGRGLNGLNGHGGAGAGGAGSTWCLVVKATGSSGGGGGEGGEGGEGGQGGGFGGASIALLVDGSGSMVRLENSAVTSGGGGRGGHGAPGGEAGSGGQGGKGGSNANWIGENSSGGGGGSGGNGGGGGAAGQGGIAYNVFQRAGGIARINAPRGSTIPAAGTNGAFGVGGKPGGGALGGKGGQSSIDLWLFEIFFSAASGYTGSGGVKGSDGGTPAAPPVGCVKGGIDGSGNYYCSPA